MIYNYIFITSDNKHNMYVNAGDIIRLRNGEVYLVGERKDGDATFVHTDGWFIGNAHVLYRLHVDDNSTFPIILIRNDENIGATNITKLTQSYIIDERVAPGIFFPESKTPK